MLQRVAIVLGVLLLISIGLEGCGPVTYFAMHLPVVNGKPYLVLESFSATDVTETHFAIYSPKNGGQQWEEAASDRLGHAFGTFVARTPESERLGIFHN